MTELQKIALMKVLALAERQLEQDRGQLSGPSITLEMVAEVESDDAAIDMLRADFNLPREIVIEVGPCNMTEAEIQDAIHMTETGTDPATAVMLAKQHP